MQIDPMEERQRLTALYGQMSEVELRELAAGIDDLTDGAKDVLRDELKKRRFPEDPSALPNALNSRDPEDDLGEFPDDSLGEENDHEAPPEFTWKTPLCACDTNREAQAILLALREAGVDAWVEAQRTSVGTTGARVVVAADQLELARVIASGPIPQNIVDEADQAPAEFTAPVCPACSAADPILESVDPQNQWFCESCEHTWADPVQDLAQ